MHFRQVERAVVALAPGRTLRGPPPRPHRSRAGPRFPGLNGRIVFNDQGGSLMLVNPNGSGVVRVARTYASDYTIGASFSRDGTQIAYSTNRGGDVETSS